MPFATSVILRACEAANDVAAAAVSGATACGNAAGAGWCSAAGAVRELRIGRCRARDFHADLTFDGEVVDA